MTETLPSRSSALVLFSGGQDSATCLAWALERYERVETVGFDYGQRHAVEMAARLRVRDGMATALPEFADRLGPDHVVDLTGFGAIGETALTTDRAIEIGARGLPTTFVPGTTWSSSAWRRLWPTDAGWMFWSAACARRTSRATPTAAATLSRP